MESDFWTSYKLNRNEVFCTWPFCYSRSWPATREPERLLWWSGRCGRLCELGPELFVQWRFWGVSTALWQRIFSVQDDPLLGCNERWDLNRERLSLRRNHGDSSDVACYQTRNPTPRIPTVSEPNKRNLHPEIRLRPQAFPASLCFHFLRVLQWPGSGEDKADCQRSPDPNTHSEG